MSAPCTEKLRMKLMSVILHVLCLSLISGNAVFAEPYLMLDASPATYHLCIPISVHFLLHVRLLCYRLRMTIELPFNSGMESINEFSNNIFIECYD